MSVLLISDLMATWVIVHHNSCFKLSMIKPLLYLIIDTEPVVSSNRYYVKCPLLFVTEYKIQKPNFLLFGSVAEKKTFIPSHPSWSSNSFYQHRSIASLFSFCPWQSFSTTSVQFSLVFLLVWNPLLYAVRYKYLIPHRHSRPMRPMERIPSKIGYYGDKLYYVSNFWDWLSFLLGALSPFPKATWRTEVGKGMVETTGVEQ